jgi:hypothetical protein
MTAETVDTPTPEHLAVADVSTPSGTVTQGHFNREQSAELGRRRRGRNIAMLVSLLALSALFYAIAIVKLSGH